MRGSRIVYRMSTTRWAKCQTMSATWVRVGLKHHDGEPREEDVCRPMPPMMKPCSVLPPRPQAISLPGLNPIQ